MRYLLDLIRGFLMGSADVVPGVSGGTVALVLGIYPRLVHSIRTGAAALGELVRGRWGRAMDRLREVEWSLLLPLLLGIGLAIVTLAAFLETALEEHPRETAAVFFGLVVGSVVVAWRLVDRWDGPRLAAGAVVAVIAFLVLGLRGDSVTDPSLLFFFGAGAIAIVAMILPGISGSFILLMLGMYQAVIAAVNDRDVAVLAVFAVGAIIGLALFSTLLDRLLDQYPNTMLAALIGLMVGSLRVLWPWPDGTESAALASPDGNVLALTLMALAAAAVVVVIGLVSTRSE